MAKPSDTRAAFEIFQINKWGLTEPEVLILETLANLPRREWIGVEQLGSRSGGLTKDAIQRVHEPFLVRRGLVNISKRGRQISRAGREIVEEYIEGDWV